MDLKLIKKYLEGRLNDQEVDLFFDWINRTEANKKYFFEFKAAYDISNQCEVDINKSWSLLLNKQKSTHPTRNRYYGMFKHSCVFATIVLTVLITLQIRGLLDTELVSTRFVAGTGPVANVVELIDGSKVSLGPQSILTYRSDYGKNDRIVHLEGEAFFEVAQNNNKPFKPFIVKIQDQEILALGTQFNVMTYPLDSLSITTVQEGSVQLTSSFSIHKIKLSPNQQYVYNKITKKSRVNKTDAEQFRAWTSGYYYFPKQRLTDILQRLSNVYNVKFIVSSKALGNQQFTGTFCRTQSVNEILEIIKLSIPITYHINEQQIYITYY